MKTSLEEVRNRKLCLDKKITSFPYQIDKYSFISIYNTRTFESIQLK